MGSQEARSSVHPNGEEFNMLCNATTADEDGDERFAQCEKLIKDARQVLALSPIHGIRACVPNYISDLRLLFSALHWLGDRTDSDNMESDEIIARAWSKSWPCSVDS